MTILVGLDGSAHSAATLSFTADIAHAFGSDVVTLHCRRSRSGEVPVPVDELDVSAPQWSRAFAERGVENRMVVMNNDPRHGLVDRAKSEQVEMVVVGSRGNGGFRGLRLGGTADYVIHHLECPVAVVFESGGPVAGGTSVVGVDGSDANRVAAEWAIRAAGLAGGQIRAVFVHDPMADSYPHPSVDNWCYHGQEVTDQMVKELADESDVEIDYRNIAGHVVTTLDAVANSCDAGYIVVGTRGHRSAGGRLIGRAATQLLHHAHRPVVVVPHGRH